MVGVAISSTAAPKWSEGSRQSRPGAAAVRAAHPVGHFQPRGGVPRGQRRLAGAALRPGDPVALRRVLAPADRRRLRPRRRLRRQPLPAMAGAPGARRHAGAVRGAAGARRGGPAGGGGRRRRGMVPRAPAALPAARAGRRGARRHPVLPRRAVHRSRARRRPSGWRARPATACGPGAATSTA